MSTRTDVWVGVCLVAGALAPNLAMAETANDAGISEMVVTATKRGVNVQDVPASISALGEEDLANRGVLDVEGLAQAVPNMDFGIHDGATFITIRGVGSTINSGVTEPTVASYVDGIYLPRPTMALLRAVDLERVEVLRGPQGTLYGRNATGGAVNFVAAAPSEEFTGGVNVSTGSRSAFGASGFVSGAIADGLQLRLSAGREGHQSYLRVLPNGKTDSVDVTYGRAALRFEPNDDLSVDVAFRYEKDEGADTYQQMLSLSSSPLLPPGTLQTSEENRTAADAPFGLEIESRIASATVNWAISDAVSVRSITGYIDHTATLDFDADGTGYAFFTAENFERPSESFSQEFNMLGEAGNLQWLVGAYYFHEEFSISLPVRFPSGLNTGDPASSLPVGTRAEQGTDEETTSYALFTDLTWSFTDALRLNAGLRFNSEKKDFSWFGGATIPGLGFLGLANQRSDDDNQKLLPKLALQYDLDEDTNLYVQYQRGFKSGGHNLSLDTLYDSETIDAYELGMKSQWLDRTLTLNAAAFFYSYSGLQITNNVGPTTTAVENADADIYGLELESLWRVTPDVTVNVGATWLRAEYTKFTSFDAARPGLGFIDLDGEDVVRSPKYTLMFGAQWRIPLEAGPLGDLTLRADVFHTDDIVLRYFATANDVQDAYTVTNLSATLRDSSDRFALRFFVDNVGDEEYLRQIDYLSAIGIYDGNYNEPRTWGVRLSASF